STAPGIAASLAAAATLAMLVLPFAAATTTAPAAAATLAGMVVTALAEAVLARTVEAPHLGLRAVVVGTLDLDQVRGDPLGEPQSRAVVEADALFPGVEGVDHEHRIVARGALAGLGRVLLRDREVQEAAASAAQPEAARALELGLGHCH